MNQDLLKYNKEWPAPARARHSRGDVRPVGHVAQPTQGTLMFVGACVILVVGLLACTCLQTCVCACICEQLCVYLTAFVRKW